MQRCSLGTPCGCCWWRWRRCGWFTHAGTHNNTRTRIPTLIHIHTLTSSSIGTSISTDAAALHGCTSTTHTDTTHSRHIRAASTLTAATVAALTLPYRVRKP
jgi:hypothetical protein